jgi:ribosomal protein L7/L12
MNEGEIYKRISALEAKVDHLYRHLVGPEGGSAAIPPMPSIDQTASTEVLDLLRQGDKIGAMKQYRAETGCDLAVAQEAISVLAGG